MTCPQSVFTRAAMIRAFEDETARQHQAGNIACPIYLCRGQEFVPACVAEAWPEATVFPQHRCHGWYLCYGGSYWRLVYQLTGGPEGSASLSADHMLGHDGLMGSNVPIAVGFAVTTGKPVVAVCGDAAAEEDYFLTSLGWAATRKAPVLFVVEDNDRSILTPKADRRSWSIVSVANAMGIPAWDVNDDPVLLLGQLRATALTLPVLLNVRVCRHYWHAGSGTDGPPLWDQYERVKSLMGGWADMEDYLWRGKAGEAWAKASEKPLPNAPRTTSMQAVLSPG